MAKKPTPLAGEATTTNYGWVKPTVGSSVDLWGGYINADLDSIDGVVHAIDTRSVGVTVSDTPPANPLVGQEWFDGVSGQLYVWYNDGNSSQWVIAVNAAASLLPASTTVLGGVKVDGTTIQAAPDGTISTTVVPLGDNRIINGDMRIDQRNNGAAGNTTSVFTVDRWSYISNQPNKGNWQGTSSSGLAGFPRCLAFVSTSAYSSLAGDVFFFSQGIEADAVSDFAWGSASAQPVTLSFWVMSSLSGTFSGSVRNYAGTRAYPFTYSLPSANVWTKIAITIPGDTAGTWVMGGNGGAIILDFDLGSGATSRGPANAWTSTGYLGVTGSVSVVATNGAQFYLTGVKLEIGSIATPYNRQSLAKSMADCQRYFQVTPNAQTSAAGWQGTNGIVSGSMLFPVTMRAVPTVVYSGIVYGNAFALQLGGISAYQVTHQCQITAGPGYGYASAAFSLSAEL